MIPFRSLLTPLCAALLLLCAPPAAAATSATLRVVTYNIEADIDDITTPRSGLDTVLAAIGQQTVNGITRPIDLLALQETTSNAVTVAPILTSLNATYGAGTYATSPYQASESNNNPSSGNGPNALVYNTHTLELVESVSLGTPLGSSNGVYREVVRYQLKPIGSATANAFYVYVSHMKSNYGTASVVQAARNKEASIIRASLASLPAGATFLCLGDFNMSGSTEDAYQTLTTTGSGQAIDPINPTRDYTQDWLLSTYAENMTSSPSSLHYRDDIQFMSPDTYTGSSAHGLRLISGSYHPFGNNGTAGYGNSVTRSSNTALDNLTGSLAQSTVLTALTTASDHLPVVADYTILLNYAPKITVRGKKKIRTTALRYKLRGTASDPDGDTICVQVKIGSHAWKRAQGSTKWHLIIRLKSGLNKIAIRAIDSAGNKSMTMSKRIKVLAR